MTREEETPKATRVGNYRFTGKVLGKGSFAVVEEAIHERLKYKVSVKTINLQKCNVYVLKHLNREASILHQLNHPFILRLFETMKYANKYCLVTEIVRGRDLCSYVRDHRNKKLDEETTRRLSRQIITALAYLHDRGIVHRDLKLENIMLDSQKEIIKLVDFGLSNQWRMESPLRTLCGSPEYCAPELFVAGSQYGSEVDMWSLGVIIYAMAVGQLPFPCSSSMMKCQEKKNGFITMIQNGLTEAHLSLTKGYPAEFNELLQGLINPCSEERLAVHDALQDTWLSNSNHWAIVQHETPDVYDMARVVEKVCKMIEIPEDRLRAELKNRPGGEIAGIYNIMVYKENQPKREDKEFCEDVSSRMMLKMSLRKLHLKRPVEKETVSKILVMGTPPKINEDNRPKKPLQRGIYTMHTPTSSSSSTQNKHRSSSSNYSNTGIKLSRGDWTSIPPQNFRAKGTDVPPVKTQNRSKKAEMLLQSPNKFKEKLVGFHQPKLPSKMKIKYPKGNVDMEKQYSIH